MNGHHLRNGAPLLFQTAPKMTLFLHQKMGQNCGFSKSVTDHTGSRSKPPPPRLSYALV